MRFSHKCNEILQTYLDKLLPQIHLIEFYVKIKSKPNFEFIYNIPTNTNNNNL